jgi:hypothetical protein
MTISGEVWRMEGKLRIYEKKRLIMCKNPKWEEAV